MYISFDGIGFETENFIMREIGDIIVYWSGLIWMEGYKAGVESIDNMVSLYKDNSLIPFKDLYGAFSVIINDHGRFVIFTDNSNLHRLYISKNAVSDQFLRLARNDGNMIFDRRGICEFLTFGCVYFKRTLSADIKTSDSMYYYILSSGCFKAIDKQIGDISTPSNIVDFAGFFKKMAYSFSNLNVTLSLTGGNDSRMIFACLYKYLSLHPFIMGEDGADENSVISGKVAEIAGMKRELVNVAKTPLNEKTLWKAFLISDAAYEFANSSFFRVNGFLDKRRDSGYELYLSGDAGELYKDWEWMVDFPFYKKKNTDIINYYRKRLTPIKNNISVGDALRNEMRDLEMNFVSDMRQYIKPINSQSFDNFYYNLMGDQIAKAYTNGTSPSFMKYAPLMELQLVRYSYHLPRHDRVFYRFIRNVVTNENPEIAKIPTTSLTTASNHPLYLIKDAFLQIIDYFKKAIRLFGKAVFKKVWLKPIIYSWDYKDDIRKLSITKCAFSYAQSKGFFNRDIDYQSIPQNILARLLCIYMLEEYVKRYDSIMNIVEGK